MAFSGRSIKDASKQVTKFFPAAGANNQTATIDLGPGAYKTEEIEIEIAVPALANHTDSTKIILIDLQESADDSSYANTSPFIELKVPGVASTGSLAVTKRFRLPADTLRYIQFKQTVPSADGDNTAGLVTYSLLF